ncbi:MAG: aryl-sulfate sulfotransferase [Planctomycetes bacterium]|nr:aryl-sulfate sulfotransferase [Planctomycetota bacterium]
MRTLPYTARFRPFALLAVSASLALLPRADGAGPAPSAQTPDSKPADAAPAKPADDEPRGLRVNDPAATPGYTLLAPLNSKTLYLVDAKGEVAHTWVTQFAPGGVTRLLPNGHVLRAAQLPDPKRFHGGGIAGRIEELDWDGNVVWSYELATDERILHHDFDVLPNGHLVCIAWEYHSPDELRAHGRAPKFVHEEGLWTDVLIEVAPKRPSGGDIVWTWRSWDHLVQDLDPKAPDHGQLADHVGRIDLNADHRYMPPKESDEDREKREERERQMRGLGYVGGDDPDEADDAKHAHGGKDAPKDAPVKDTKDDGKNGTPPKPKPKDEIAADWLHTNAVHYLPAQDLLVVSTPHLCEIWVIDHSTTTAEAATESGGRWKHGGALLYRYGHARNYGRGDATSRKLFYQHNPTWLPATNANELRVLVYNNGSKRPGKEHSSVDELVLPFDPKQGFTRAADAAFGPAEPAWAYKDVEHFYSGFISGAQRLANGNTLVCEGAKGRVFEITRDGKIVWDYWSPLGGDIEPAKHGGKAPPKALFRAERIAPDHPGLAGRF